MKKKILLDTGFFHVYFSGSNYISKKVVEEIYANKIIAYTLDLNLAELFYTYAKVNGIQSTKTKISLILSLPIKIVSTTKDLAIKAGELKIKNNNLSIVDCYLIALGETENAEIYTTDSEIAKIYNNTNFLERN